jgi:hypothetical protein
MKPMDRPRRCAICGAGGSRGMMVAGQFICPECQALLDDPKKRVFGCGSDICMADRQTGKSMELAKAKE